MFNSFSYTLISIPHTPQVPKSVLNFQQPTIRADKHERNLINRQMGTSKCSCFDMAGLETGVSGIVYEVNPNLKVSYKKYMVGNRLLNVPTICAEG